MEIKNSFEAKLKGTHLITLCDMRTQKARQLERAIELLSLKRQRAIKMGNNDMLHSYWLLYKKLLHELHSGFMVKQVYVENITTSVGHNVFARLLSGDNTYSGNVNYGALGTDNTAPVIGDTTLGTETYRKALSSGTYLNNQAFLENFYTAAETSGTFEEYGFFIDGNGAADSGVLFNRFTQQVVKANTESLNVQSTITISDA